MAWGRIARDVAYAGLSGTALSIVATAFTVVAVGLPLLVDLESVLLASGLSVCFGSVIAAVSVYGHLDRTSRVDSARTL